MPQYLFDKAGGTLPQTFYDWLRVDHRSYDFTNQFFYTLPEPRYDFYETSSYNTMQDRILEQTDKLVEAAGFYDINVEYELLEKMKETEAPLLFIGLIFNILLLIFIVVSVLLIYSLLLISVETKTFEIGVMRLMGLSKAGFIALILTEAMCFVIPSIFAGFICSMPCISIIYSYAFT